MQDQPTPQEHLRQAISQPSQHFKDWLKRFNLQKSLTTADFRRLGAINVQFACNIENLIVERQGLGLAPLPDDLLDQLAQVVSLTAPRHPKPLRKIMGLTKIPGKVLRKAAPGTNVR